MYNNQRFHYKLCYLNDSKRVYTDIYGIDLYILYTAPISGQTCKPTTFPIVDALVMPCLSFAGEVRWIYPLCVPKMSSYLAGKSIDSFYHPKTSSE